MTALLAALLAAVAGTAIVGERLAARTLHEQVERQLLTSRDRAALALETHVDETRTTLAALAADPRTVAAFRRLRRATHELDTAAATAPRSMQPHRAVVRDYLRRYYVDELRQNALRLDSLLVPHSAAILLQSTFFVGRQDESDGSSSRGSGSGSLYETENEIWQPIFAGLVRRFGWQDLLLADAADGRILYSVSKTPVFQTSLIEGPYSESGLGTLFRDLREAGHGTAKWADFAPFVPAHGQPVSFAGTPIFEETTRIGVLLVEEQRDRLGRVISANGRWPAVGLGASGDLFVVGSDSRMRSHPRFFELLRAMHPAVERDGTTVLAFDIDSIPEVSESNARPVRYVNHRGVSVLGAAKHLEVPELSWIVVAEIDEAEALAPLVRLREALGLVFLGVLLLGTGVTLAVVKRTRRPMTQVLETLRAVRDGDSTVRVPTQAVGKLGALGEAVNELIEAHAGWVRQENAERQERETEIHELVLVLKGLARGDFSQRARVDRHLAGLANAVNAMGTSVGQLTDRLCVAPPRVAETAYAMQTVAEQILRDAERQTDDLDSAGMLATEMLDWLRGCTIDAAGLVDAASRVEQIGREMQQRPDPDVRPDDGERVVERQSALDESREGSWPNGPLPPVTARYQRLRATIDEAETLRGAVRGAVDVARRIRTAAETLRGHVQTLQLIALDLHTQGSAGRGLGANGGGESSAQDDSTIRQSIAPRA